MSITIYHYPDGWGAWCPVCNEIFSFGSKSHVEVEAKQHVCPTSRAVDLPTESRQPSWADDGLDDAVIGSLP